MQWDYLEILLCLNGLATPGTSSYYRNSPNRPKPKRGDLCTAIQSDRYDETLTGHIEYNYHYILISKILNSNVLNLILTTLHCVTMSLSCSLLLRKDTNPAVAVRWMRYSTSYYTCISLIPVLPRGFTSRLLDLRLDKSAVYCTVLYCTHHHQTCPF